MRYFFPILAFVAVLAGCSTHRASSIAWAVRNPKGGYVIQLTEVGWCAGGPCNFPQWPHREYGTQRISTETLEGVIPAEQLTLSYGDPPYGWSQTKLQGSVTFSDGHMSVALRVPVWADDGSIRHYVRYPLTGTYKLHLR
jgi:hypothetical protein